MSGRMNSLAAWFVEAHDVSGPYDDEIREALLAELDRAIAWGKHGRDVLVATPRSRAVLTPKSVDGCRLVEFDVVTDRTIETESVSLSGRYSFWMNASSVAGLGSRLRETPRGDADRIFLGPDVEILGRAS